VTVRCVYAHAHERNMDSDVDGIDVRYILHILLTWPTFLLRGPNNRKRERETIIIRSGGGVMKLENPSN
jgi:hypothetical protein